MAVQNPQKLSIAMAVCRQDRPYKDYTSNPIPTSLLFPCHPSAGYTLRLLRKVLRKGDVGIGLLV